jgi:hypothetical protein
MPRSWSYIDTFVIRGEARTRGTAQVSRKQTGGAQPPPHIGRQSRGIDELFQMRGQSQYA